MHPIKLNFRAVSSLLIFGTQIPGVSIKYAVGSSQTLNPSTFLVVQGNELVLAILFLICPS